MGSSCEGCGGALFLMAGVAHFPGDETDEEGGHGDALPAFDGASGGVGSDDEDEHGEDHEGEVDAEHLSGGRQGMDEGGESEDEGDVGDVGASDVADGES